MVLHFKAGVVPFSCFLDKKSLTLVISTAKIQSKSSFLAKNQRFEQKSKICSANRSDSKFTSY